MNTNTSTDRTIAAVQDAGFKAAALAVAEGTSVGIMRDGEAYVSCDLLSELIAAFAEAVQNEGIQPTGIQVASAVTSAVYAARLQASLWG